MLLKYSIVVDSKDDWARGDGRGVGGMSGRTDEDILEVRFFEELFF